MKVRCLNCRHGMIYSYRQRGECNWTPEVKLLGRVKELAAKYRKEHPEEIEALIDIERSEEMRVAPKRKKR